MELRIEDIDINTICNLFPHCKACVYWEYPEQFDEPNHGDNSSLKQEWLQTMIEQFGPCGSILYVNDEIAAYCQYINPQAVPGISRYQGLMPHVDKDAVLITCLWVSGEYQRKGLGRKLLEEVINRLRNRGFRAVQTIGRDDSANNCSGPTQFYLGKGFSKVATETYPRGDSYTLLRLDL